MEKVWFITGAARGIGAAIAKAALDAGDSVVATSRNLPQLQAAFADRGGRLLTLALDVDEEAAAPSAVAAALQHFDRIDVLVNNAGYGQLGLFEEVNAADVQRQFTTNVFGLMNVTRAVLPTMRRQRAGHIINLSSMGGVRGFGGASVYCASKFAIEGFADSLAPEVAPFGIKVTTVEPGFTRTDFLDRSSVRYGSIAIDDYAEASKTARDSYEQYNHRQAGDPEKLGRLIVGLASADNPPLHLASGSDAVEGIGEALQSRLDTLANWRDASVSVDGDV